MHEFDDVAVPRGPMVALSAVNIEELRGNLAILLVAKGAGKTLEARAVTGLVPLTGGSVRLGGKPTVKSVESRMRLGVAIVPEGYQLWSEMTVSESEVESGQDSRSWAWSRQ